MKHWICAVLCLCMLSGLTLGAAAAQTEGTETYCFVPADFAQGAENLTGICLTRLPGASVGAVMLGDRALRPGDVLTMQQVEEMTFCPVNSQLDRVAEVGYLPIYPDAVAREAVMTISIRGKEDQPPVAEDFAAETYKNLETTGRLKVHDPENRAMTYTVVRQPKRGTLEITPEGSFCYTPKKNKIGIDSFVYTATDAAGKTSREATVTITILKPTDAKQYTDTAGMDCRFSAEWMKNTGIFAGETLGGSPCFQPEKTVTQGEFLTMLTKVLELPAEETMTQAGYEDIPAWLQPYLAAAVRSGLTADLPESFRADAPLDAQTAAVLLCNGLHLRREDRDAAAVDETVTPGTMAVQAAAEQGFTFPNPVLTRADAAQALYLASCLSGNHRILGAKA